MLNKSIIKVNDDKQLIAKLHRLNVIEKDEHGEFVWAQVGGDYITGSERGNANQVSSFKMYLGNEVEVPADFAGKLLAGYPVPLDKPCPQCWNEKLGESTGYTVAGICHQCKGNKFIDLNRTVNTFVLVKAVDGGDAFDPKKLAPPKKTPKQAAA